MAINKSKRYDEAIKVAKSKIKNDKDHVLYENDIIEIFPELKESEDEKIRKEIIAHIKWCEDSGYCAKEEMTRWITWLEKQGKPIDKIVKRAMTEKQGKQGEQNLPSFDESQGTPILKQGEQNPAELGEAFLRPQNTQNMWKPTRKQLMALRWVLNYIPYGIHKEEISGLFDQIKEL